MIDLSIVLVHYRTPELVAPAIEALLVDLAASAIAPRIFLVDNGSEASDRETWSRLPIRILGDGENLGYAGGLRAAMEVTSSPFVVVMNPDVEVREGCLSHLMAALAEGAAAAGPQFYWDRGATLRLPPTEERTRRAELLTLLARRSTSVAGIAQRRWRRHARRHWLARSRLSSTALSGALLAFRRDAWQQIGPFDTGYRLYFEETDWLLRLKRAGGRAVFEPRASAFHWYAQSSLGEPSSARWFAESERRFRALHYGRLTSRALARFGARPLPAAPTAAPIRPTSSTMPPAIPIPVSPGSPSSWIEVSPFASGFPAAASQLGEGATVWNFPPDTWRRLAPGPLWARFVNDRGRVSPATRIEKLD